MNIDEMQAGRELDALIVEKVMGEAVKWFRYAENDNQSEPWEPDWDGTTSNPIECKPDDADAFPNVENYSTDIAAAWQVVEKMRERFQIITLSSDKSLGQPEWHFHLANYPFPHNKKSDFDGWGDTAPLAICRAALKAVDSVMSRDNP